MLTPSRALAGQSRGRRQHPTLPGGRQREATIDSDRVEGLVGARWAHLVETWDVSSSLAEPVPDEARAARRLKVAATFSALAYFIFACFLLPDFGPTWDVAIGSYPYGEKVVGWVASDVSDFVEFTETGAALESRQPYPAIGGSGFEWYKVFPVGGTLAAVSSRVLWHHLGLVPAIMARHLVGPATVALLIYALIVFLGRRVTLGAALGAAALLVASPRFLTHSLTNIKDAPETVFYNLALFAIYRALIDRTVRAWILLGIATALALAQKANRAANNVTNRERRMSFALHFTQCRQSVRSLSALSNREQQRMIV